MIQKVVAYKKNNYNFTQKYATQLMCIQNTILFDYSDDYSKGTTLEDSLFPADSKYFSKQPL